MMRQAKSDHLAPMRSRALTAVAMGAVLALSGCGGGRSVHEEAAAEKVDQAHLKRTLLEAHNPEATPVEARIAISAASGATGISAQEAADLKSFGQDYVKLGRGNVVVSIPANATNSQSAAYVAQDVQRILFMSGVDYARIVSGPYQAQGQGDAPILVSFGRYEAKPMKCQPWSEIDPRKTASNMPADRFGCAQNANLAAMIVDPGDFLADRKDAPKDGARLQKGLDMTRKGEVPKVSGAVAGGGGGR
jgi:pilus assembly protein CpaD